MNKQNLKEINNHNVNVKEAEFKTKKKKQNHKPKRNFTLIKNSHLQKDLLSLHIKMYMVKSVSNKVK